MKKHFDIELSSNLDYNGMTINILYNEEPISLVHYDKGIDNIEMVLECNKTKFPLEGFLDAILKAKKLALQCAKEDEDFRSQGIDI